MILSNVFQTLLFEKNKGADMGASVFGLSEIHERLLDFKGKLTGQELYFVKVDIKQAFDTIRHDVLMRILQEYLTEVKLSGCMRLDLLCRTSTCCSDMS